MEALGLLIHPWVVALLVPVVVVVIGALETKKISGDPLCSQKNFYWGLPLSLTALGGGFGQMFALATAGVKGMPLIGTLVFVMVALLGVEIIGGFHQDWESRRDSPIAQFFLLVVLSNALGMLLVWVFFLHLQR